jgi:hypothetical protein
MSEVRIIISAHGVKREIVGPYSVCGSTADLKSLRDALNGFFESGAVYGWVDVVEKPVRVADQAPEPWCAVITEAE